MVSYNPFTNHLPALPVTSKGWPPAVARFQPVRLGGERRGRGGRDQPPTCGRMFLPQDQVPWAGMRGPGRTVIVNLLMT